MLKNHKHLLAASIATVVSSIGVAPVLAQDSTLTIEEVVVTAQKRAQSTQDIGMAITAMGGDELARLGITDVADLAEFIPNVELSNSSDSNIPIIVIRGVGLQDYNTNNTPTTAMYLDDVYLPYNAMAAFTLFDMERVEVLKGPQGGLYGRNTTAGAMNFISRRGNFESLEGDIAVDVGNYGYYGIRAGVSVPFSDKVAMRLALQHDKSDGYYENTYLDKDQGGMDKTLARLTLSFQPSDSFSADLRLTYGEDKSEVGIPEVLGTLDINASAANYDFGVGNPDLNVPLDAETEEFAFCQSYLKNGVAGGSDCINMGRFAGDGKEFKGVEEEVYAADNSFEGASLVLNWDLEAVTLVSISAMNNLDFDQPNGDGMVGQNNNPEWDDFAPLLGAAVDPHWFVGYRSKIDSWSQEFRLLSNSDGPLSWLAGASYSEDDFEEFRSTVIDGNLYYNYIIFPGGGILSYDQHTEATSFYGQLAYEFGEAFKLTGEARHTSEQKGYEGGAVVNGGWLLEVGAIDGPIDLVPGGAESDYDEDNVSWKVSLDYTPNENTLVYLSAGKGYKSGGFFGGFLTAPEQVEAYEPESNLAYELGVKSTLLDGAMQLNAAVFFYDYENWQGNITTLDTNQGNSGFSGLTNMGDVETTGIEFDLRWLPAEGWDIRLGAGWLDSKIVETYAPGEAGEGIITGIFDDFNNLIDVVGNTPSQTPEFTFNAMARYDFTMGSSLMAAVQVDGSYTDEYYLGITNLPSTYIPSYTRYNARMELYGANSGWNVALWGRNLSDEIYRTAGSFGDGLGNSWDMFSAPRTYGATLSYVF